MLYKRIRDLREDNDLTQKKMGEILSCSQRVYSNYERGELDIPTEILIKLADFHKIFPPFFNRSNDYQMPLSTFQPSFTNWSRVRLQEPKVMNSSIFMPSGS